LFWSRANSACTSRISTPSAFSAIDAMSIGDRFPDVRDDIQEKNLRIGFDRRDHRSN
jgi:hypothetical protein